MDPIPEIEAERKPLTDHLEDLRRCIIRSLTAVFVCGAIAFVFSDQLLLWVTSPLNLETYKLYYFGPADGFLIRLKLALLFGIVMGSPVLATQIWSFVAPGLFEKERKALIPWIVFSSVLFVIGASFAFKIVLPIALQFLMGFQTWFLKPMIAVSQYVSFVSALLLAFGVAFNMPVIILGMVAMKLIQIETLVKFRRHAYVGVFVMAMILTPPDMLTQFLLGIPMILLYEMSLLGARLISRRSRSH